MSVFKLPNRLCNEISSILTKLWWGTTNQTKKIYCMSWIKLDYSIMEGIMGLRNFEYFNSALLVKQLWRILMKLEFLAASILKEKYF